MKNKREASTKYKINRRKKRVIRIWKTVGILSGVFFMIFLYDRMFSISTMDKENTDYAETEQVSDEQPEITGVTEPEDEMIKIRQAAKKVLERMTLEERIYQLFIVTPEQLTGVESVTQAGEATKNAISKYPVGGIVYFANNLLSREQCKTMIKNIQSYSEIDLFIAVDEEGGSVARLGNQSQMGTTAFPSMGIIGNTEDVFKAYEVGVVIGKEISELGFNLDFAPVADVYSNPENKVIGDRAFHSDFQMAAKMVAACVQGFGDSGMLCTLKHFPGHGDTVADSHYGEVKISKNLEELFERELIPFQAGIDAGAPFVMVGHITAPQITGEDIPATLSYELVTEVLRKQMGFQGIVITDSMAMQAITDKYSSGTAAVKALEAGADILLMPQDLQGAVEGVASAVQKGILTEERIDESVLRILEMKISKEIIELEEK